MKLCPKCPAYFNGEKWVYEARRRLIRIKQKDYESELCPGCEKIEKEWIEGVVKIAGGFFKEHKKEIDNLIDNVAERTRRRNPSARLLSKKEEKGELTIETTDRTLAERIGREMQKAFSGELDIQWLKKAEYSRVFWKRD